MKIKIPNADSFRLNVHIKPIEIFTFPVPNIYEGLLFIQFSLVFLAPLLSRVIPNFDKLIQLIYSAIFFVLLSNELKIKLKTKYFLLFLTLIATVIVSLIWSNVIVPIVEVFLICSNFVFLLLHKRIGKTGLSYIIWALVVFSSLQIGFDLLFPTDELDPKDVYAGSFIMANNKSRYLGFIIPVLIGLPKQFFFRSKPLKFFLILGVLYSLYLGFSTISFLLIVSSIGLSLIVKKLWVLLSLTTIFLLIVPSIFESNQHITPVRMNYHRFFHKEHGVAAVYSYGWEKLIESKGIGVGLGGFSSRAGQLFKTETTQGIPKTLIKFWQPLFDTKAPYGLSSLFTLLVELGGLALVPLYFLFGYLSSILKRRHFILSYMGIYTFFLMNYNPTFFEFNESVLYMVPLFFLHKEIV